MGKCRIYITFDYELFFGPASGSVAACMLEPTRRLMALGQHQDVRFTFFVDAGMLCALRTRMERYPELAEAYQAVTSQLGGLAREGHSIQLHIHPHWEDARYSAGQWQFDLSRYRLHMFSPEEADGLIRRYHNPARLYVVFSGGVMFWRTRAINYVWSNRQPVDSSWPNAFTGRAYMIAIESGTDRVGQWVRERRGIRADYWRAFGEEPGRVEAVAIMTDTDNTGLVTTAWYGDIWFTDR